MGVYINKYISGEPFPSCCCGTPNMSNQPIPEGVTTFDPKLMYNDPEGPTFEILGMDRDDDMPWWTEPEDNVSQKGESANNASRRSESVNSVSQRSESAAASVQKKGRKQKKEDGKNNEQKQKNRPESTGQRQSTRKRRASAPSLASPSTSKVPATTTNRRSARLQSTSSASQSTSRPRANSTVTLTSRKDYCRNCKTQFANNGYSRHKTKQVRCPDCNRLICGENQYKAHKARNHPDTKATVKTVVEKNFKCSVVGCGMKFSRAETMRRHMNNPKIHPKV